MSRIETSNIFKPELLAPAGSIDALHAALKAGADAIYIGGTKFGARAYADNPDESALLDAIDEVHVLDRKLYMTVNTLLKDQEIRKELYSYIRPFYEHGLDGVIIQDLGVARFLRREFPNLVLHASTQMAVTGAESARFLKEQGFERVVPAREMSLEEIKNIYDQTGMEIEAFVHGAMCYSISGMCLMSSLIGGRSGNRGRCAGVCRLPFQVKDKGVLINDKNTAYPLNMKDMCTVGLIPEMIEAGVCSFKIEGRMKRPEYTAGITRIYRKYIDMYLKDPSHYHVVQKDLDELATLFNRDGFTESYYKQRNGRQMIALHNDKMTEQKSDSRTHAAKELYDQIAKELHQTPLQKGVYGSLYLSEDGMAILNTSLEDPMDEHISYEDNCFASVTADIVQMAKKQPMTESRIRDQLNKTGNSDFYFKELEIQMPSEDIFIPVKALNELRRDCFALLHDEIMKKYFRSSAETKSEVINDSDYFKQSSKNKETQIYILAEDLFVLNHLIEKNSNVDGYYIPIEYLLEDDRTITQILEQNKKVRIAMPYVLRMEHVEMCESVIRVLVKKYGQNIDGILVRNMDSVALLKRMAMEEYIILDSGVYTMNSEAREFWNENGVCRDTLSHELNYRELSKMQNTNSEMVVYGRTPMMISAQCIQKTCRKCTKANTRLSLTDRKGAQFPVVCNCVFCYNVIYNSLPLNLFEELDSIRKLNVKSIRLTFTTENMRSVDEIIAQYTLLNEDNSEKGNFTKEHFRRGVE